MGRSAHATIRWRRVAATPADVNADRGSNPLQARPPSSLQPSTLIKPSKQRGGGGGTKRKTMTRIATTGGTATEG